MERVGKGVREPPRDALAAEITQKKILAKEGEIKKIIESRARKARQIPCCA
jgi:hypothetical protein